LSHQLQKLGGIIILSHYLLVPYLIWFSQEEGVWELEFPLWLTLLGGSFVFLDVGLSILFLVFIPPFLDALVFFLLAVFHHLLVSNGLPFLVV
jgi:hypothetical protein